MIEAVSALLSALPDLQSAASGVGSATPLQAGGVAAAGGANGASFAATLRSALDRVDGAVSSADGLAKASAAGNHDIPLSDVMVSLEQANLAMQMAANVRDKIVSAYTSIMNMPV